MSKLGSREKLRRCKIKIDFGAMFTRVAVYGKSVVRNRRSLRLPTRRSFMEMDGWFKDMMSDPENVDVLAAMPAWKCHSDEEYGGKSTAEITMSAPNKGGERDSVPFLRFQGVLRDHDHDVDEMQGGVLGRAAGSFSAVKAEYLRNAIDLMGYEGLEVDVQSSVTRPFSLNLTCLSVFEDDLYQFSFLLKAGERTKLHIPFTYFRLTAAGREREFQREADTLQVESIGFMAHRRPKRLPVVVATSVEGLGLGEGKVKQGKESAGENGPLGADPTGPLAGPEDDAPFALDVFAVTALHRLDYSTVNRLQLDAQSGHGGSTPSSSAGGGGGGGGGGRGSDEMH
jgi:hypothetical protein